MGQDSLSTLLFFTWLFSSSRDWLLASCLEPTEDVVQLTLALTCSTYDPCTVVRAGCEQGRHESEGSTAPLYFLEQAGGRRMTVPRYITHSMHPTGTIHTGHY